MSTNKEASEDKGRDNSGSDAVTEPYGGRSTMAKICVQCEDIAIKDKTCDTDVVDGRRSSCWKCTRKETSQGGSTERDIDKKDVEELPTEMNSGTKNPSISYVRPRTKSSMDITESPPMNIESRQRYSDQIKLRRSKSFKVTTSKPKPSVVNVEGITEYCGSHSGKIMEYYCRNHSELLCSVCMSLNHTDCTAHKSVEYIPNFVNTVDVENNLKDTICQIGELTKLCREQKDLTTKKISNVIEMFNRVNEEIREFRKRVNERIDELESKIVKETQYVRDKMTTSFIKLCDRFDTTIEQLKNLHFELHKCQESQNTPQSFVIIQKTEKEIKKQKRVSGISEKDEALDEYFFEAEKKLETLITSVNNFGSLRKKQRLKSTEIRGEGVINVRSKDDKKDSWVTGLAILSEDRVIAVDADNQIVKLIDTKDNILLTTLRIPSRLHDVARIPVNKCAVTLPHRQKILLISVSNDELCVEQAVKVDGKCYGIAPIDDRHIVVSFLEPARLQILTLDGTLVREIAHDGMQNALFSCPEYISVSKNGTRIYVSDYDRDTLTMLSIEGNVKRVFKGTRDDSKVLEGPKAVYASEDGFVYVCGSDSNNVLMLTEDCDKYRVILAHEHRLQHPVCFGEVRQPATTSVLVSDGSNSLKVFKY